MKLELTTIITIILIYISGSIFFIEYLYPISYIVVFVTLFIMNLLKKFNKVYLIDVIFITFLIVLSLITLLISNDSDISSYLGFITSLFIAFFASRLLTKSNFLTIYTKIVSFLSFTSIIFFIFGLINPNFIVENLTFIKGIQDVDYYNAFIHVYQYSKNASLLFNRVYIDPRNASIFWESGVFQAFININIYLILKNTNFNSRQRILLLFINIVALITTYSITGLFILILIILDYFYKLIKYDEYRRKNIVLNILTITLIILFIFVFGGFNIILSRILEYGDNINDFINAIIKRTYIQNLKVFNDNIQYLFFGFGYGFLRSESANSIVEVIITNGLFFSFTLIYYLQFKLKKYFKSSTLFQIMLLIFFSEPLLQKPFFLLFLFLQEDN